MIEMECKSYKQMISSSHQLDMLFNKFLDIYPHLPKDDGK